MMTIKITKATEKRVNALRKTEDTTMEQQLVIWIYDEMLDRVGCHGASINELEKWGIEIWADDQMKGRYGYTAIMNGLSCKYPDLIHYTDTHGLNCLTIKDFNKLVKAVA